MNLQHWDLKDVFTLSQVARLINGWDPEIEHIGDVALAAKVRFIERELRNSVENAMQGVLNFFSEDLDKLGDASWVVRSEQGWLPSTDVELAITAYHHARAKLDEAESAERRSKLLESWTEILNRHYTSIERKLLANERSDSNLRLGEKLNRSCVHRWLTSVALQSAYNFEPLRDKKPLNVNSSTENEPPHPRTKKYYVALIAAMAIDKYGYEPEAARSATPGDLSALLGASGLPLSDEVIRGYLKEGAGHLNPKTRR